MAKISKSAYAEIKQNVGGPLSVIYDKIEKNGSITFNDIQDEYVHMHNYIENLETGTDDDAPLRVSIDGREYKPSDS